MEGPSGPSSPDVPAIRISDTDRENVIAVLRSACGDGRITLDEFAERAGVVYASSTQTELDAVVRDLPTPTAPATTNPASVPGEPGRWIVAIMNGAHRRGRWRVAPRTTALAFWGGLKLDLRGAIVEHPIVELNAWAIMGGVDITVPDGIPVEVTGMVVMGATVNRVKDTPALGGAPLVRVKARGLWGGVHVRSRPMGERPRVHAERHAQWAIENAQRHADRALRRAEQVAARYRGPVPPDSSVDDASDVPSQRPLYAERPADPDFSSMVTDLREDPVDIAAQTASDGTVTILFSDIEGSTELADRLGDRQWLDVVREHNKLFREQIAMAGGREVKAQGDGFMVTFPSASRALRCAIDIQRALAGWRETRPDTPVHVRIGVHTGEVLAEGGDIYGKHVMIAARIASQARGGEVLASSLVRELADGSGIAFGAGRDVELRGLERPWRLYPVDWIDD
jgi:class 3 adenylate cyclase